AFGDLKLKQVSRHPGRGQHLVKVSEQVGVQELPRRKIDRHRNGGKAFTLPGHVLDARAPENPSANRNDESRLFGERNELRGRKIAKLRVRPSQQSLNAADLAGRNLELGLIVQCELIEFNCVTQVRFQLQPLD